MRFTALIAVAALCVAAQGNAQDQKPPELKIEPLKAAAPVIDGALDDAAWKDAAAAEVAKLSDGSPGQGKARLLITRDDKTVYIAVESFESEEALKMLKADITEHDVDGIWDDDDVELFIDPAGTRESYYQIIVNSRGATWDAYHAQPRQADNSWEPKYEVKTAVGKNSWTVEFAFPVATFDRTDKAAADWVFNVVHVRSAGELLFWSPVLTGSAHTPDQFGKLLGMPTK
jgi:hypothetical protein